MRGEEGARRRTRRGAKARSEEEAAKMGDRAARERLEKDLRDANVFGTVGEPVRLGRESGRVMERCR